MDGSQTGTRVLATLRPLLMPALFIGLAWSKIEPAPEPGTEAERAPDLAPKPEAPKAMRYPDGPSYSKGSPNAGELKDGGQVLSGPYFVVRDPERAWVTADAARWLGKGFEALHRERPRAPRATVLDASLQHGGPMAGHRSHQSGRDVDLSYLQRNCAVACPQREIAPEDLHATAQWALLRGWLVREQAKFVFVDYALQEPLYEAAKAAGEPEDNLRHWIQYPRGRHANAVIRHANNHHDHMHVRFSCGPHDTTCRSAYAKRRRPVRDRVDGFLSAIVSRLF